MKTIGFRGLAYFQTHPYIDQENTCKQELVLSSSPQNLGEILVSRCAVAIAPDVNTGGRRVRKRQTAKEADRGDSRA